MIRMECRAKDLLELQQEQDLVDRSRALLTLVDTVTYFYSIPGIVFRKSYPMSPTVTLNLNSINL